MFITIKNSISRKNIGGAIKMNRKQAISYAQVALSSLKEFGILITPATMYIEMEALMYEYTGRQILRESNKL